MIVGSNFAYAHVPKTGGDATAVYLRALVPCAFDLPFEARKHDPFWERSECYAKQHRLCGIRRLPDWTWSMMHELSAHMDRIGAGDRQPRQRPVRAVDALGRPQPAARQSSGARHSLDPM